MPLSIPQNLRALAKRPAFAAAAIAIVALGVALATTAASIVDALVFRPIPVENFSQLYRVHSGVYRGECTPPDVRDIFEATDEAAFGYHHRFSVEYATGAHSGLIVLCELQGDPFRVLNWQAQEGRLLQPSDFQKGSEPVTVISHAFWKNDLGSPADIVGQSVKLNGKPFRVVGVLPPERNRVHRTIKPHAWTALVHTFDNWLYDNRNSQWQNLVARIPTPERVVRYQTQLDQIEARLKQAFPAETPNMNLQAIPESAAARVSSAEAAKQSYIIVALVATLLLVACFNVGNMLLANAYRREREFAIHRSVGASSLQIARILLTESFAVAFLGGALGVLLSLWLVRLADQLPFTRWVDVQLDGKTLLIALAATLATGLISGLAPTWHLARGNTADSLKRGAKDSSVAFATKFLVVAQVALSAALLTASFLYTQSLRHSFEFNPGYDTDTLSFFSFSVQSVPDGRRTQVATELRDQIAALPGVVSAAYANSRPLGGMSSTHLKTDEFDPGGEADKCFSNFTMVSLGFTGTLGVPMVAGRDFLDTEFVWPFQVALVNESFQRRFFPENSAVGKEFWPWGATGEDRVRIVGVFKDYTTEPGTDPRPLFLLPQASPRMTMLVRSEGDPLSIRDTLATLIHDPNNEYVAQEINDFAYAQNQALSNERSALYVLTVLAVCALFLSSTGIWYTTRQFVRQSRKELSIRLAIGARPRDLVRLTLRRSLCLVAIGLAVGAALSFVTARWIQHSIDAVSASQPLPYLLTLGTLLVVATAACYLPARSASKADPKEALGEV